jgi:hypothetical protein
VSTVEAFLLGIMAAWTPSLILLACLLNDRITSYSENSLGDGQQ